MVMSQMNAKWWITCWGLVSAMLAGAQAAPHRGGSNTGTGPIRLARVSFAEGDDPGGQTTRVHGSKATVNLPLQQGAEVWVARHGRAEVQFDDGSNMRLGNEAVISLHSLYADSQGEFTEVKLNDGTAALHLKDKYSLYQVDTPVDESRQPVPPNIGST